MAPSDKNFIRNLCLAAGLFFAFLLIAPINFTAPAGTGPAPVGVDTKTVPLPEVPVVPEVVPEVNEVVSEVPDVVPEVPEVPDATAAPSAEFLDNKENIPDLAAQVCNENAASLGLTTTAELERQCYQPVVQSLSEQVDSTLEQVIPVELDIEGRTVQFEIDTAAPSSIGEQANNFCVNYGAQFGVTQETLGECTQNVEQALQDKLADVMAAKQAKQAAPVAQHQPEEVPVQETAPTFQMDLDIQGRTVRFNVEANYESIGQQATAFCTTYGAEFGVTQESLGECRQNIQRALEERVVAYLEQQQQQQQQAAPPVAQDLANATFQMDLDIQGRTVRFNVEANYESIGQQATAFCTTYGAEFGVTQESLGECQQNIQRALEERVVTYLSTH